jgi:hypothetical protein
MPAPSLPASSSWTSTACCATQLTRTAEAAAAKCTNGSVECQGSMNASPALPGRSAALLRRHAFAIMVVAMRIPSIATQQEPRLCGCSKPASVCTQQRHQMLWARSSALHTWPDRGRVMPPAPTLHRQRQCCNNVVGAPAMAAKRRAWAAPNEPKLQACMLGHAQPHPVVLFLNLVFKVGTAALQLNLAQRRQGPRHVWFLAVKLAACNSRV